MKKTRVKFIAFCDYASVSQEGKLSVNGIFDQVRVAQFPGGVARAFFVAMLTTEPNIKTVFSIKGILGDKTVFPPIELETQVGDTGGQNIFFDLAGITFPEKGVYKFILFQDGKEIGLTELTVGGAKNYDQSVKLPN